MKKLLLNCFQFNFNFFDFQLFFCVHWKFISCSNFIFYYPEKITTTTAMISNTHTHIGFSFEIYRLKGIIEIFFLFSLLFLIRFDYLFLFLFLISLQCLLLLLLFLLLVLVLLLLQYISVNEIFWKKKLHLQQQQPISFLI